MAGVYFNDDMERFAYRAWETLALKPPANVFKVADRLGVRVYQEEFVEEIDGLYLRTPSAPPIAAINTSYVKPVSRQRFTLAHEVAHHLIYESGASKSKLFVVDGVKTRKNALERSCDRFAALLLMPENLTREWFNDLSSNPENRVAIMSERFGVSAWAMRIRLKELGLPHRNWRSRR